MTSIKLPTVSRCVLAAVLCALWAAAPGLTPAEGSPKSKAPSKPVVGGVKLYGYLEDGTYLSVDAYDTEGAVYLERNDFSNDDCDISWYSWQGEVVLTISSSNLESATLLAVLTGDDGEPIGFLELNFAGEGHVYRHKKDFVTEATVTGSLILGDEHLDVDVVLEDFWGFYKYYWAWIFTGDGWAW